MSFNDDHPRALSDTERAALAEIDRREGYEMRLLAAQLVLLGLPHRRGARCFCRFSSFLFGLDDALLRRH